MPLTIQPLRRSDAKLISSWRYPEPYHIYDIDMRWSMVIQQICLFFGQSIFYAANAANDSEQGDLVGFFSFVMRGDTLDVGVAMRPDLTGQGGGLPFMLAGLDFARATFRPRRFRLDVARFNQRARLVYERAGFRATRTVYRRLHDHEYECLEMVRDA